MGSCGSNIVCDRVDAPESASANSEEAVRVPTWACYFVLHLRLIGFGRENVGHRHRLGSSSGSTDQPTNHTQKILKSGNPKVENKKKLGRGFEYIEAFVNPKKKKTKKQKK